MLIAAAQPALVENSTARTMQRPCDPKTATNPTSLMRRVQTTTTAFLLIGAMIDGNRRESKHGEVSRDIGKALFRRAKLRCASNEQYALARRLHRLSLSQFLRSIF